MKALVLAIALAAMPRIQASDARPIGRAQIVNAEDLINGELAAMYPDERYFILSPARGMFLEHFGIVFMAEINLVTAPAITPFHQTVSKEEISRHHDRKLSRLPKLKTDLISILGKTAAAIPSTPDAGNIVLGITLVRYPWENSAGIPSQMVLQAESAKLAEAQRKGEALKSLVHVSEY